MSELIEQETKAVAKYDMSDDINMSSGVYLGAAFIRLKGKEFVLLQSGERTLLGKTLDVVIVASNKLPSRTYYDKPFDGKTISKPTCASADGIVPDKAIKSPCSKTCEYCPKNVLGSRITRSGAKAKDCGSCRRIVVSIPTSDGNEIFRLDVPSMSLKPLALYNESLRRKGTPVNAVITRISFVPDVDYPKLEFNSLQTMSPDSQEYALYKSIGKEERTLRLLKMETAPDDVDIDEEATVVAAKKPITENETKIAVETVNATNETINVDDLETEFDTMIEEGGL